MRAVIIQRDGFMKYMHVGDEPPRFFVQPKYNLSVLWTAEKIDTLEPTPIYEFALERIYKDEFDNETAIYKEQ